MRMRGSISKGLLITLVFALTPLSAFGTNHAGPKTPSCGNYKVTKNEVIVGIKFPKGTYQVNTFGISCSKVMGSKGLFAKFLKLRDKDPLPKPWRYLADAVGAPKFSSGPGVGFRVQLLTATPRVSQTPTPTPTPTLTATQTPIPTPTPEPTPTFVFPSPEPLTEKAPTGFSNLVENYSGISKVVWSEIQKLALLGSPKSFFDIEFGPQTTLQPGVGKPQDYFEKTSKLWTNYSQPKTTKAFFFGFADLSWVQEKNRALGGSPFKPEELADNCKNAIECGAFGGAYKGLGQIFIGVSSRERPTWNLGWIRSTLGHEFTHTVQDTQLDAPANVKLPCWFAEGQPQVAGQALSFETLEDYRKSRLALINQPAGAIESYSPDSILRFYEATGGSGNGKCSQNLRARVYDIGFFTVEALAAIRGIHSTMDLVVSVSKGVNFETSFKNIYGISWNEAAPILAQTVSQIYSKG